MSNVSAETTTHSAAASNLSQLEELEKKFEILHSNTNDFFIIIIGIIIFFMQGGFAFLEAGSVRTKNTVNILIKNFLDSLIGGVSYWAIGWAVAYGPGGNGFIGGSNFFSYGIEYSSYPAWFFQFVFAATAATIVSGALAERCQFSAYLVYSVVITGWVYPIVSHWAWDSKTPGFLNEMGFKDFAGSGVVHLTGGVAALVGCILLGPRAGRFDASGKTVDMPGHSVPLAALGGFILIFGFLAFNGGSQAAIASEGDSHAVARAIVNTIIGGCGGGLIVLFANKFVIGDKWSYLMTLNGSLTGMVAQCSGCDVYQPWAAFVIGVIGGIGFLSVRALMLKFNFDDPLDAVGVHCCGGLLGVVSVHFFAYDTGIFWKGGTVDPWRSLGVNVLGAFIIICWSGFWSLAMFWPLKYFNFLRVDREVEFRGNDLLKHGEAAYPAEAWVETQYSHEKIEATVGLPGNMSDKSDATFNNAFEMVPTSGKLFKQMSNFALMSPAVTGGNDGSPKPDAKDKGERNVAFENGDEDVEVK